MVKQMNGAFRVFEGTEVGNGTVSPVNALLEPVFLPVGQHLVGHGSLRWDGYLT